jgi:MFS family permease
MASLTVAEADRATRHAALALALALPGDIVLYLLLPLYPDVFGVTLPEVGVLLAANRLVRIVGYQWVASLYAMRGPRLTCLLAVVATILSTLGYTLLSGFWALLALRLMWGLAFAGLNIANQALASAVAVDMSRRAGRARAIVAAGPTLGLLGGALLAEFAGPRIVFLVLGLVAVPALLFARWLPHAPEAIAARAPAVSWPSPLNVWAFCAGFTLDGIFIVGLAITVAAHQPHGAIVAAGAAMALRYALEIVLSPVSGRVAQRAGPRRLLVGCAMTAAFGLALVAMADLSSSDAVLWAGLLTTIVLRAALQPLPGPVVAEAYPGSARVTALAAQATWRDIGAGLGPLAAGVLLPVLAPAALYGSAAVLLLGASLALMGSGPRRRD